MTSGCPVCSEIKPRFYRPKQTPNLIKSTQPMERLSMDFKGPLPTCTKNRYLLTLINEYSRFSFAFPCADMTAATVINCLNRLLSIFGMPHYVHSDRGSQFMSEELKSFLHEKGIATSRSTPYNPRGNGQVERLNNTIWKAITLSLKSKGLSIDQWELVLQDSLHSVRSLLCTETNATPHERMFLYSRRSTNVNSLPSWLLSPGPVYLKRHVRASKYDPIVDEVELLEANSQYANVRLPDGRESTVSLRHLAPDGNERQIEPAPGGTLDNAQAPDLPPDSEAKSTPEPDVVTLPDQTTEATNLEADDSPGPLSLPETLLPPEPTANPR
ncbi:Pro-Pol polyprotein [Elysia marginata]|uniref:Pro-Pol polyprotein n=1 Tax=Elysia marginata TaxID=1093978 RepID=A0AAV4FKA7_9GAST|nr:Pro-Pol polyprotein [Elysia marginata]